MNDAGTVAIFARHALNDTSNLAKIICHLNACAAIGVFTWLNDPDISVLACFERIVGLCKLNELGVAVIGPFYMKRKRNCYSEWVDILRSVVGANIREESFLV